jgi:iron complex transport system substrate-binding protein
MRALARGFAGIALVLAAMLAQAGISVVDDAGRTVALRAPAQRIVSLAPHATELLFELGAGSRVVGASAASDWPAAAKAVPRVGDARAVDLERVMALAPDLVVTWPYTAPREVELLRARGVAVFVLDARTIDALPSQVLRLGRLLGEAARAEALAAARASEIAALSARYRDAARVVVFYQVWNAPLYTIGGTHLISQALALCGGVNAFAAETLPAPAVSVEAVLAARPQAIIAGTDRGARPAWLDDWRRWPVLPAVAAGELHAVDADLLHRAGPRFVAGVAELCTTIDGVRARAAAAAGVHARR